MTTTLVVFKLVDIKDVVFHHAVVIVGLTIVKGILYFQGVLQGFSIVVSVSSSVIGKYHREFCLIQGELLLGASHR